MATTTKKPTTTRQPANRTTTKSKNNDNYGQTIFLNFGFNFNGVKAKSVTYLNLNNIFYSAEDKRSKKLQKDFSESETYKIATTIIHEELSKAMKKAQQKINKKLTKLDSSLSEDEKKNISIYLSANISDSSKDDTKAKDIKF